MASGENTALMRKRHGSILEDRKNLTLTGVKDVSGFDEQKVILQTELGELTIKGGNLHIVEGTSVDGPGLRTSIYLAGCNHRCPGCHNPDSWDFKGGEERTLDELMQVIAYNEAPVTLSGGDPLLQPDGTRALIHRIKQDLGYNVWCYTGFTWEEIEKDPALLDVVRELDVLVDGPFLQAQRDISLRFRGSRNQRLIDVQRTLATGQLTLWP